MGVVVLYGLVKQPTLAGTRRRRQSDSESVIGADTSRKAPTEAARPPLDSTEQHAIFLAINRTSDSRTPDSEAAAGS